MQAAFTCNGGVVLVQGINLVLQYFQVLQYCSISKCHLKSSSNGPFLVVKNKQEIIHFFPADILSDGACVGSGSESCQNPVVEMKSEQK